MAPWRDSEVCCAAGSLADLGELVFGSGEADLEAFDFAVPALAFGLAMRAVRLSRISARRACWAGSGQSMGQRTQV